MKNQVSKVHVTIHQSRRGSNSKLDGMSSINTTPELNPTCEARRKAGIDHVCSHCYSKRMLGYRCKLAKPYEENYRYLNEHELTMEEAAAVPIGTLYCRIESMGETGSVMHAINYLKIIDTHPLTKFGWWTKNWHFLQIAIEKFGHKPKNLTIVLSSSIIGNVRDIDTEERLRTEYQADHLFTVYPKDTPDEQINCGGRRCMDCLKCYKKDTEFHIKERLK